MVGTPEFTIKAKDRFAIQIMAHYRRICIHHGLRDQAHEVLKAIREMTAWRAVHFEEVQFPDHQHIPLGWGQAEGRLRMHGLYAIPGLEGVWTLMGMETSDMGEDGHCQLRFVRADAEMVESHDYKTDKRLP